MNVLSSVLKISLYWCVQSDPCWCWRRYSCWGCRDDDNEQCKVCRTACIDMFVCLTLPSLTECLSLLMHTVRPMLMMTAFNWYQLFLNLYLSLDVGSYSEAVGTSATAEEAATMSTEDARCVLCPVSLITYHQSLIITHYSSLIITH